MAVLLLEVVKGPTAALPAAIFLSIIVGVLGNFRCLFIFLGVLVRACPIGPFLRVLFFSFRSCSYSPSNIL